MGSRWLKTEYYGGKTIDFSRYDNGDVIAYFTIEGGVRQIRGRSKAEVFDMAKNEIDAGQKMPVSWKPVDKDTIEITFDDGTKRKYPVQTHMESQR